MSQDRGVPGQVTGVLGHVTGDTFGCPRTPLSWDIYPTVPGHLTYEFLLKRARRSVGGVSLKESMLLILMVLSVFLLNAVFAS